MSATFDRLDPITGAIATTASAMTVAETNAVADAAQQALDGWAALGPNARRTLLNKASDALAAKGGAVADAMRSKSARP